MFFLYLSYFKNVVGNMCDEVEDEDDDDEDEGEDEDDFDEEVDEFSEEIFRRKFIIIKYVIVEFVKLG